MDVITLFTSDSRPKYINDALGVLALPQEVRYQFRYEAKYLPNAVRTLFDSGAPKNLSLLIAFKSEPKVVRETAILVPLRWAKLVEVEKITDFFVIRFSVNGYPTFKNDSPPRDREELEKISSAYLAELPTEEAVLPVHIGATTLVETTDRDDKNSWISIAKVLSFHDIFRDTHFLRISPPTDDHRKPLRRDKDDNFEIKEGHYLHVPIDYFANTYNDGGVYLEAVPDGQTLRIAWAGKTPLDSRYDSIRMWFQAKHVSGRTRSEILIQTDGGKNRAHTIIRVPMVVRNSRLRFLSQILVSGTGAVLLAVPGLLGASSDPWLRAAIAALGALLLSLSLYVAGRVR